MKTLFRILALILLAACLVGCVQNDDPIVRPSIVTSPQKEETVPVGRTEMDGYYLQYLPAEVENPDNLPVLKWVCLTEILYGGTKRVWSEDAVHALNRMLSQRELPFRVQFVMLTLDKKMIETDWFTRPGVQELLAEADLIFADMTADEMTQYLWPITDLLAEDSETSLKNAVPHSLLWRRVTVGEEIYGVPAMATQAHVLYWEADLDVLETYGLSASDFSADLGQMEALFARLRGMGETRPLFYFVDGKVTYGTEMYGVLNAALPMSLSEYIKNEYQLIGSCFGLDTRSGTPEVVFLPEAEDVRVWQQMLLGFRDKGYVTEKHDQALFRSNICGTAGVHIGYDGQSLAIPVGTPVFPYEVAYGAVNGIGIGSRHKDQAAGILHLIAEDEEFRMQLFYGKEGADYTVENGYYSIVQQKDGSNYSLDFLSPLSYFSGMATELGSYDSLISMSTDSTLYPETEGKSSLEAYRDTLDHCTAYLPIVFDFSGLAPELSKMEDIMTYFFGLYTNNVQIEDDPETEEDEFIPRMDEENYQIMLDELKAAGGDKILAELQRQLDEWLAENPDWNK